MARPVDQQITKRAPIDSSQSQGVPLGVTARIEDALPRSTPASALAQALNQYSSHVAGMAGEHARQQAASDAARAKEDQKTGAAMAAEAHVTGEKPTLDNLSGDIVRGYQQADGILASSDFENFVRPSMARLEPGENIDEFMQGKVQEYLAQKQLPDASRETFMVSLAKTQDSLKQEYLKQSITEGLKRQEETAGALATNAFRDGSGVSPEGYTQLRAYMAHQFGMSDHEINAVIADAAHAELRSGQGNNDALMAVLKRGGADGRGNLWSTPEFREKLDMADKAGKDAQEAALKRADTDAVAAVMDRANALADKGLYGFKQAEADRKAHSQWLSPEWSASMAERSRNAQERLAKQRATEQRQSEVLASWGKEDRLTQAGRGFTDKELGDAGNRIFQDAVSKFLSSSEPATADNVAQSSLGATLRAAAIHDAPIPNLKSVLNTIDDSNPKLASRMLAVYEAASNISPSWANRQMDASTLAKIKQYQTRTQVFGDSPEQAWSHIKTAKEITPEALSKNLKDAMKKLDAKAPKDFGDHKWNPLTSNTKIANLPEVRVEQQRILHELVASGVDPDAAVEASIAKADSMFIRVGDRLVRNYGTGDGNDQATSAAMTEYSAALKAQLVKSNVVDKDSPVLFTPIPDKEGVWRAHAIDSFGISHAITRPGKDGQAEFIDVKPNTVRPLYAQWDATEKKKATAHEQALKKFDLPSGLSPADAVKFLDRIPAGLRNGPAGQYQREKQYQVGSAFAPLRDGHGTPEKRKAARDFFSGSSSSAQSFVDFLNTQH